MTIYAFPFTDVIDSSWKNYSHDRLPFPNQMQITHISYAALDNGALGDASYEFLNDELDPDSWFRQSKNRLSSRLNGKQCGAPYKKSKNFPIWFERNFERADGSFVLKKRYSLEEGKWMLIKEPLFVKRARKQPSKFKKGVQLKSNALLFSNCNVSSTIQLDPDNPDANIVSEKVWKQMLDTKPKYRSFPVSIVYFSEPLTFNGSPDPDNEYIPQVFDLVTYIYFGNWLEAQTGPYAFILRGVMDDFESYCDPTTLWFDYSAERDANDLVATRRLFAKVTNQKVDLATAFAEGAQTISLLADIIKRLSKLFLELKALKLTQAASDLIPILKDALPLTRKKVANDFLAFRYGISPLVSDLTGIAESLAAWAIHAPFTGCKAKSSKTYKSVENSNYFCFQKTVTTTTDVTVRYKITFRINAEFAKAVDELGFTNLANVEWELVPFSFVVDWFLPIGNFLRDFEAMRYLDVVECTKTTFIRERVEYRVRGSAGAPVLGGNLAGNVDFTTFGENVMCVREILPQPIQVLPSFKNPFSIGHIANAVALLLQTLTKR